MEGEIDKFNHFSQYLYALKCKGNVANESKNIRNFLSFLQRASSEIIRVNSSRKFDLVKLILEILASGILHQENQILMSTALCILMKRSLRDEECDEILSDCITCGNILVLTFSGLPGTSIDIEGADVFRICVSWSILQCFGVESLKSFYISNSEGMKDKKVSPFIFVFGLLEEHCNSLTNVTFIAFKMISVWLNKMEELFALNLIDELSFYFYLKKVLYIVNSNWENSVNGVREKNVEILRTIFNILPQTTPSANLSINFPNLLNFLKIVMLEVPWRMKCKYLMLTSLLRNFGIKEGLIKFPSIPSGLVYSLSFPHLVSAGTDSYREFLKEMTMDQWLDNFHCLLKTVMIGKDRIAKKNLMSYWMPETLKTFPLVVHEMLSDLLCDMNSSALFSVVALFKIGRKCGLLKWEQMDCELLKICASHLRDDIRGEAFTAVCVSTKTTSFPMQDEIEMVCLFLKENVNADSAKLRQITVTSFKVFICRLKDASCLSYNENESLVRKLEEIIGFFNWLLKFIVDNFVPGANYQRRITSLYLLRIVLDNICLEVTNKSNPRGQMSAEYIQGECWLRNKMSQGFKGDDVFTILLRCLMDSVADIRDVASGILKRHFKLPKDLFHKLWEKALSKCCSSMFYEIESGAVLAECLIHWKLCHKTISVSVEEIPFVEVLLSHAEEQKAKLEDNLLRGSMSTPVHGILNVLYRIVSSPDILAHLEFKEVQVKRLINFVDSVITFALGVLSFNHDSKLDVAPSFAEMGIAIECAITENAKCLGDIEIDELSGAQELVLNCIWLNLKVCCLVVSSLATNLSENKWGPLMKESDVEYCGHLLVRVLMKCRHKGAIESAGKSLSTFALFCASNPNPKLKELPLKMLSKCLEQTIGRKDGRASITRCSAGLSILVHRLITADGKNTVPMCVPKLLSWTEMDCLPEFCNVETEDLPQTQALHFLRAIVQDSAVYQYVSPYMSDIALMCFKNFSSGIWGIRNAALQLFGVVVPKLVGQKKGQEEDIVGSNVTMEELNAHYPALLHFLLKELKGFAINISQDSAVTSPTLLPILILCSRLTLGIPHLHTQPFTQLLMDFHSQFYLLLSSPNIAVRKSCAKAISAFTPLTQILEKIESLIFDVAKECPISENELHGKFLCIKTLRDRLDIDSQLIEEHKISFKKVPKLVEKISGKLSDRCYFTRALLCEIQGFTDCDIYALLRTVRNKSPHCCYPGLLLWAAASLECIILSSTDDSLYPIMQGCFQSGDYLLEAGLQSLTTRLEKLSLMEGVKHEIFSFLNNVCNSHASISIIMHCLNSMLQICSNSSIMLSLEQTEALFQKFCPSSNYGIVCSSVALSVVSLLIVRNGDNINAKLIAVKVVIAAHEQSLPSNLEEIRLQAVRTLMTFLPFIHFYQNLSEDEKLDDVISEKLVSSLLSTSILLLQDENEEVRTEAAKLASNFIVKGTNSTCSEESFNPHKCLDLLLAQVMLFLPLRKALQFLWEHLTNTLKPHTLKKYRPPQCIRNPFGHGIDNVFSEKFVIAKYSGDSLKCLIKCGKYDMEDIKSFLPITKSELLETAAILLSVLSMEGIGYKLDAHVEIYHTFVSVKYQLEISILLGMEGSDDSQLLLSQLERCSLKLYGQI